VSESESEGEHERKGESEGTRERVITLHHTATALPIQDESAQAVARKSEAHAPFLAPIYNMWRQKVCFAVYVYTSVLQSAAVGCRAVSRQFTVCGEEKLCFAVRV